MGSSLFPNYTLDKKPYLELKYWKIFKGVNKTTGENVSVFIFEKKSIDKKPEKEKQSILLCLRKEPETLFRGKNMHKNFLNIVQPLVEDNNSLGFITEYISYNLVSWIKDYRPSRFEVKYIIYQLLTVVYFMHNDYHISHNNLNPSNIFLTEKNFVKITGFLFTTNLPKDTKNNENGNSSLSQYLVEVYCDLKYCSPELVLNNEIHMNSDNFVLGLISYYLLGEQNSNNDLFVLVDNSYDSYSNTYKNLNIDKKINNFSTDISIKNFLKSLLQKNPDERKNISLEQNSKFFSENNNKLIPLCLLSKMESSELQNNYDLLKSLPNLLNLYSAKEKEFLILPNLLYYLKIESLINPIVPAIFMISEQNKSEINFQEKVWPIFKGLFGMKKFPAATLYFTLKKVSFLIKNLDKQEFNKYCMPLICKALDCGVQKIQEAILEELPKILNDMDKNEFQNMIYNRLVKIVMQTKNKKLKKKIMNFLIHLCDYFDSYFINNNFLDDIEKIIKSETTLNVCKNAFTLYEQIKPKVNDKSVRSKIIPSLLLMMCNGEISEDLFNKGERIINSYIEKIKEKRKAQFVEDMEIDSDSDKNIKRKPSKNANSINNVGSPVSVTRSKSNLSGNISLFEINSSEDSNFDFDDKNKNVKKEKIEKLNKNKDKKVIFTNNDGNLFDNLLDDGNNEAEIKNNDSSFDSISTGKNKNKNQFENPNKKEFLSSLRLEKIEKQKKSEIKQKEEITKLNENKKNRWEEIESDDENTDELSKYISKEKSSEKNENYDKKESKKSEKRKKWDEDEDEDNENYEDCLNFKKNENESINNEKKIDELLILNNDDSKDKNSNNPINAVLGENDENKIKNESTKKKGEKKKKKHKKKDKKDGENETGKGDDKNVEENKKNEKEKAEIKKEEKKVETSVKKTRMNPTGKNIDLDNLLFDDD